MQAGLASEPLFTAQGWYAHIIRSPSTLTNSLAEVLEALGELGGRSVEVDASCGVLDCHAGLPCDGGDTCGESSWGTKSQLRFP